MPPAGATNSMATIAFVVSLVGLLLVPVAGSIVGIILGHQARKQIAVTREGGSGLATAAIVIGWISLALIVLSVLAFFFFFFIIAASSTYN